MAPSQLNLALLKRQLIARKIVPQADDSPTPMSLEERHWPSLCIIALLLALSFVAVVSSGRTSEPD
jgi:hypothetical protein